MSSVLRRSIRPVSFLLAAGLAACSPDRAAAPAAPEVAAHREAGPRTGGRRANSVRYRDSSRPMAWGRSPVSTVSAEALRNADGSVSLEVTAYGEVPGAPSGIITKLQVKLLDASGALVATLNLNRTGANPVTALLPAIPPGGSATVLAHVTGNAGRRTEVVTVTGVTPTLRPDLAVHGVDAPYQMVVGQPAVVSATVTERGGQRGANANCVLYADGVRVDGATAIWVDAGDAVTCAFTTSFAAVGPKVLRVAVEQVVPGDADPSNNAASLSVDVAAMAAVQPGNFVAYGDVRDGDVLTVDTAWTRWTDRATGRVTFEQANAYRSFGRVQTAFIAATIGQALPLPLERLEVAMRSGGRLLHSARWTGFGAGAAGDPACAAAIPGGGFSVFLCAYSAGGFSTIQYVLAAGSVTYESVEYSRAWNGTSYDEDTWVDNYTDPASPVAPQVLGADFSFHIAATAGGATWGFGASGPLRPTSDADVQPLTCSRFVLQGPPAYDVEGCAAFSTFFTGIAGALNGSGYLSQSPATP